MSIKIKEELMKNHIVFWIYCIFKAVFFIVGIVSAIDGNWWMAILFLMLYEGMFLYSFDAILDSQLKKNRVTNLMSELLKNKKG